MVGMVIYQQENHNDQSALLCHLAFTDDDHIPGAPGDPGGPGGPGGP